MFFFVKKKPLSSFWVRVFKRSKKPNNKNATPSTFPRSLPPEAPTVSVPGKTDLNLHRPFPLLLYPRRRRMDSPVGYVAAGKRWLHPFHSPNTHAPKHGGDLRIREYTANHIGDLRIRGSFWGVFWWMPLGQKVRVLVLCFFHLVHPIFFAVQMIQLNTKNNSQEVSSKRKGIQYMDLPNMCVKNLNQILFIQKKHGPIPGIKNVEQNLDSLSGICFISPFTSNIHVGKF